MMFGFKKRHDEVISNLKVLYCMLEEIARKLQEIEDMQDPITEVTKELNETVMENGQRLNTMINELKGAVAMSRASLPKRDDVIIGKIEADKPKKSKKNA